MKRLWLASALMLIGCVHTSEMRLDANTVEISVSGAPACGDSDVQQAAYKDAAIATIRAGFDAFVIMGEGGGAESALVGMTPSYSTTSGSFYGNSYSGSTVTSGGFPIIATKHNEKLIVRMFRANDAAAAQAVPARSVLGPDWANKVANGPASTC